jgi:transposase-like protein
LNQRIRRELRRPNRPWRVDETYVRVDGTWAYLYRAVDSAGEIDFMLSPKRDLTAAKLFLRLALSAGKWIGPRVNRFIKRRIVASLGFRSAERAWRTVEGYEAMHAIRKG